MEKLLTVFCCIWCLICVTLVILTQGHFIQYNYEKVLSGKSVTGTPRGKTAERSTIECSLRCSTDSHCIAYQIKESTIENCLVVHSNSTEESGQEFTPERGITVFMKESQAHMHHWSTDPLHCNRPWLQPDGWNGSHPVVHHDFDDMTRITFYSGDNVVDESTLVLGRICSGVQTNRSLSQHVDLGDLSAACITKPSTCGSDGGTVSLWVKMIESGFIITSRSKDSEGFSVGDNGKELRYNVAWNGTTMRKRLITNDRPSGWFHMVLVLQGNRGIKVYHDKVVQNELVETINRTRLYTLGSGTTVIGKKFTDTEVHYASVAVDELTMWNRALSETEAAEIYDMII